MAILRDVYLLLAILLSKSIAQNITNVCLWTQLRAGTVRDAVYVNGGDLRTKVEVVGTTSFDGAIYAFNFSQSFETKNDNFSAFFTPLPAQGQMADYHDGTIFASNEKIYLYGGLLPVDELDRGTPAGHVVGYQLYPTGSGQMLNETLSVPSYITDGAGVSVPSESLGFYFSGMETPSGSEIVWASKPADTPSVAVESFIEVNMPSGQETRWSNLTWPAGVKPRANAQLVWLPVSSQGVLIVIGGVVDPQNLAYAEIPDNTSQIIDSQSTSPGFMTSLPVYDIRSQQWFVQDASGDVPGPLTEFCSVVAQADGSSTFEIYIYGGYDGLNGTSRGDIWVLSVPDFIWIHAYDPGSDPTDNFTHARDSHVCVKPYPDQMFVIGGENTNTDDTCINGIFDVFNLSSLSWLDRYDPTIWADYSIPSIVAGNISATPTATAMDPSLSAILGTRYPKNVSTYYPYVPLVLNSPSRLKSLPAALGAGLGGAGLLFILLAVWWFLRRKGRKSDTSGTQSSDPIHTWIDGVSTKPDASVTTTDVEEPRTEPLAGYYEVPGDWKYHQASSPQAGTSEPEAAPTHQPATPRPVHVEAHGRQMYEMYTTNTLPTSPRPVHVEAGGAERYEMRALERGSPDTPAEMEAPPRFQDHPLYPRDPAGVSQVTSPTLEARSTTSGDASSPSPYGRPSRLAEADLPHLPSPDQSPPISSTDEYRSSHKRNISSMTTPTDNGSPDLNALEAVSGLGYSNSRPVHTRNMSSLSSGIAQLPSPTEQVAPEEDHRRSALLAGLPSQSPVSSPFIQAEPHAVGTAGQENPIDPDLQPLANYQALRNTRAVVTRKQVPGQSAFKEEGFGPP